MPSSADGWMATVSSLRLEPDATTGLSGTLSGVGGSRTLRLALTQSGSTVVGSTQLLGLAIPLSGSASQGTVQLSGDSVPSGCYELSMYVQQCGQHVKNATLILDDFGRLTGTMDYSAEGTSGATPYSYTVRLVLVAVVPDL